MQGMGSIPGLRRSPGERNGSPLQCFCLGNPMDRGSWLALVHGVTSVRHDLASKQNNVEIYIYIYILLMLSHLWLFVAAWIVAHQAPLSMRFYQARILEWVAVSSSRGSSALQKVCDNLTLPKRAQRDLDSTISWWDAGWVLWGFTFWKPFSKQIRTYFVNGCVHP